MTEPSALPPSPAPASLFRLRHYAVPLGLLVLLGVGGWQAVDLLRKQPPASFSETRSVFALSAARSSATLPVVTAGPAWETLTATQRQALAPLETLWTSLPELRKREWLAVVENFDRMRPAARERLQARMKAWAALSPQERSQARLNFAGARNLPPNERRAQWEAYQSLSAEEKARLAARASTRPSGAATAPTPSGADKLVRVPAARQAPNPNPPKILTGDAPRPELFAPVLPAPAEAPPTHPDVLARPIEAPAPITTALPPLDETALQEGELAGPPVHLPPHDLYMN